ncbi:MAG: hypothetical protein AAGF12_10765 [Myxococcota bacterium]
MRYAIRSILTSCIAEQVPRLSSAEQLRIRKEAPELDIEKMASGWVLEWIDMHTHMRLSDAIRAAVGPEGNVDYWDRAMRRVITTGFYANLLRTTVRIYGTTPLAYFKVFSRGADYATRNIGHVALLDHSSEHATMELYDFPADEFSFPCYVEGIQGCLNAAYPVLEVAGEVALLELEEAVGRARYRCSWTLP